MKRKADNRSGSGARREPIDADDVALRALDRLASDPARLGNFLAATGLDPRTLRGAAREPGFLAAVLDHVAADEGLLVAIAGEIGMAPEDVGRAQAILSAVPDFDP